MQRRSSAVLRRLLLALVLTLCVAGCSPTPTDPPNVVLVTVDTLRFDAIGPYGGQARTPVLDRLARDGVLFEYAFAPAPTTASSHATLFTGQEPLQHGVVRNATQVPDEAETLAEVARTAGRATAAFVSSFILDDRFGWNQGFDHYDDDFTEAGASVVRGRGAPDRLWDEHRIRGFDRRAKPTTEAAANWLATAPEPFFLFVHYFDPHSPYSPPSRFAQATESLEVELGSRQVQGLSPDDLRRAIRLYLAEVESVDASLGHLVSEFGHLQRPTLLIVTSDHGEGLGQRGLLGHALHLHDELTRVPLIIWRSDRPFGGRRIQTPVALADVAPTIAALADLPPLSRVDGRSLESSVEDSETPEERPILAHRVRLEELNAPLRAERLALRLGGWKLLRAGRREKLFDLARDPGETKDVRARHEDVADALASELDQRVARRRSAVPRYDTSPEVREGLEALGYTE